MLAIDIDHVYMYTIHALFNFVSFSHFFRDISRILKNFLLVGCKIAKRESRQCQKGLNNSDNLKRDFLPASLEEDHACRHVYVCGN